MSKWGKKNKKFNEVKEMENGTIGMANKFFFLNKQQNTNTHTYITQAAKHVENPPI
jgi:hypothetical protein